MNQKQLTTEQKIASISDDIANLEQGGVSEFYGTEMGIAKLVRDDRTFRIFYKEVQKAKSGKAVLVEMKVFIKKGGEEFAVVRGHTYLPNFVIENKDVYWVLKNKINNATTDDPEHGNIRIDKTYIPKEFNTYGNFWSNENSSTPEEHVQSHLKFLRKFRESFVKELKVEKAILGFMEMIA